MFALLRDIFLSFSPWCKLGVALVIGICSAMLNMYWLNSQVETLDFVTFRNRVLPDQEVSSADIKAIGLPRHIAKNCKNTFLSWEKRFLLIGQQTGRKYAKGDLALIKVDEPDISVRPGRIPCELELVVGSQVVNLLEVGEDIQLVLTQQDKTTQLPKMRLLALQRRFDSEGICIGCDITVEATKEGFAQLNQAKQSMENSIAIVAS